jgi:hypothetical protein
MRQIADGVFEVAVGYVHAHLIVVDGGVALVDTGLPKRSAEIGRALHAMRRRGGEVQGVRGIGGRCATSPPIRAETRSSRRFAGASRCGTVTRPYRSRSPRRGAGTPDSS